MALVKEVITSNGVRVRIMDDCYAGVPMEELRRRDRELRRVLDRIALSAARAAEQKRLEGEGANDGQDREP